MIPLDEINPFEYFFGSELSIFNVTDVLLGGSVIPLVSIVAGYMLSAYGFKGKKHLGKILLILLVILSLNAVLIFGSDIMPIVVLSAFIGLIFVGRHWIISMAASLVLFILHLMFNVVLEIITGLSSNIQHMYSGIQRVNEYISTYRSSDYLAMVNMNIDTLTNFGDSLYSIVFIVLPALFFGVALRELNLIDFYKRSPYIAAGIIMVLLAGGIATKLIEILTLGSITGETLGEGFGGPVTAVGYFMLLAYITDSIPAVISKPFYNLGRYGLSAYLLFNIIMMFIFYGFGLAFYGQISFQLLLIITVSLYVLMIILSNLMAAYNIRSIEHTFQTNEKMIRE